MRDPSTVAPLKGVRVLELGTYLAGPLTTTHLAQLGASVTAVERPDDARGAKAEAAWRPSVRDALRANKVIVQLDLRTADGRSELHSLLQSADVDLDLLAIRRERLGRCEFRGLLVAAGGHLVEGDQQHRKAAHGLVKTLPLHLQHHGRMHGDHISGRGLPQQQGDFTHHVARCQGRHLQSLAIVFTYRNRH